MADGCRSLDKFVFAMHEVTKPIRRDYIAAVLEGARGTYRVLLDLTEDELHAALDLEYSTQRRASVMHRLIGRAAALQRDRLLRKYIGGGA